MVKPRVVVTKPSDFEIKIRFTWLRVMVALAIKSSVLTNNNQVNHLLQSILTHLDLSHGGSIAFRELSSENAK